MYFTVYNWSKMYYKGINKRRYIMKLVKIQLDILEDAVASEAKNGVRKPIHVRNFKTLDGFSQRYQEYCNRMEMLINAGFISRDINPNDGYAYITIKGENFINGVTY